MIRLSFVMAFCAQSAVAAPLFEDKSSALPAHEYAGGWEHFVGGGVAVFDCDNNGLQDVFAAGGAHPPILARNLGAFAFKPAPLPELTETTGAYPLDVDADGFIDLFVLRIGADVLLRGQGDCTFTDATAEFGILPEDKWSTAFSAWWGAGDARPTIAVGHYVDRSNPNGPFEACDTNTLLRPDGDRYTASLLEPGFCALSMLAATDARGLPTLRISNDRQYYVRHGNEQMWDITDQRFLTEEDGWATVKLWGMGIASQDLNGDGRDEVMLTSMGDQMLQFAQVNGTYAPAPFDIGTYAHIPFTGGEGRPSTGWHAQFGDVDNDGRTDLFIAKGNVDQMPSNAMADPNNLLQQQPDGRFVETALAAGIATTERSRGAALADFDNDGLLDLLVANRRAPLELYRNVTPDTGHWLAVELAQAGGNRLAVGARVTIGAQSQQRTIGGGHASGQSTPLHFGLGDATQVDVQVTWPDGTQTTATVAADQQITLTKP